MAVIDLKGNANINSESKVVFKRDLKDNAWFLLKNKKVLLFDKKNKTTRELDTVRGISFIKFYISSLNKMRIEDGKKYRKRITILKEKIRELKNKNRELRKRKRIKAQAKLIK